jgi:hypothetical protein
MNVVLTFSCHGILNPRQATARTHGTKNSYVKIDDAKVSRKILLNKGYVEVFRIFCRNEEL